MDARILDLIATVTGCWEVPREPAPGHPPTGTVRVLATLRRFLRRFLREGTPWRRLRAGAGQASGSARRRAFERQARTGLLRKAHARLVAMLRGHAVPILDRCSARAQRGGDLTGPNPADRGCDAEGNPALCRSFGAEPRVRKRRQPSRSGSGRQRWPVERSNAWLLEDKRPAWRCNRRGFIVQALLQTARMLPVAGRLAREL